MATVFNSSFAPSSRPPAYNGPTVVTASSVPAGTFAPGTKVQVGGHRVMIEKYLSEGGFAHVYLVRLLKPINGEGGAVLKRVAVPDKEALASMRTEVETMKKLKGHRQIVTYIDSHASQLKGGGYEVFLLMEYCNGGGLIDFMNTRLKTRLTEPEILKIFSDVAQGVACMHYLKPPLLHRDLKVENVLSSSTNSSRMYKLCDFGSTAPPRPAATNAAEGRLIEEDVQKHTTLQYRSPEMIDVYRKQPIDEKSDIWALGVLLYKLCYYTTPFEEQGQMAILNASFKFPNYPSFSDRTKKLIASMLRENPHQRPNIYQVVQEVCLMRGTDIPIKDIYAGRTQSENRRNEKLPSPESNVASPPSTGAYKSPVVEDTLSVPDIVPMRRGRPTKTSSDNTCTQPSPSPNRGTSSDPFAALDAAQPSVPDHTLADDISTRFPPLDEFSLLHDSGSSFAFSPKPQSNIKHPKHIAQRVTEALADDAFAQPTYPRKPLPIPSDPPRNISTGTMNRLGRSNPANMEFSRNSSLRRPVEQPTMVSEGTMTSPSPPSGTHSMSNSIRPIFRFPSSEKRASSQPRGSETSRFPTTSSGPDASDLGQPRNRDHRSNSQTGSLRVSKSPASSRPSLESRRPSNMDLENTINRSKSASTRSRPSSAYVRSNMNFLREKAAFRGKSQGDSPPQSSFVPEKVQSVSTGSSSDGEEAVKISSNVEFLRAMEEEDPAKRKEKRNSNSTKHVKRASMPSISLLGTKSLLAGRFGDAFRRFEANTSGNGQRPPSPLEHGASELTPIAGSERTDDRSDDDHILEETEIPPEVRRELERRRLSQEERRVSDAAAAYRQRLDESEDSSRPCPPPGKTNRAASIQSKVISLLHENGRVSPSHPAEGYGHFTDVPNLPQARQPPDAVLPKFKAPQLQRRPPSNSLSAHPTTKPDPLIRPPPSATSAPLDRSFPRPNAPPKPRALRTGTREERAPPSPSKPSFLAAKERSSQAFLSSSDGATASPPQHMRDEDWEASFSKRYPSLSGLEMVETEIREVGGGKVRDV